MSTIRRKYEPCLGSDKDENGMDGDDTGDEGQVQVP